MSTTTTPAASLDEAQAVIPPRSEAAESLFRDVPRFYDLAVLSVVDRINLERYHKHDELIPQLTEATVAELRTKGLIDESAIHAVTTQVTLALQETVDRFANDLQARIEGPSGLRMVLKSLIPQIRRI